MGGQEPRDLIGPPSHPVGYGVRGISTAHPVSHGRAGSQPGDLQEDIWTQDGTEDFLVCQEAGGVWAVGSYPQPLRSPVVRGRRSGAMDNFLGFIL